MKLDNNTPVRSEQLSLLESQMPMGLIGSIILSTLCAYVFWDLIPHNLIIPWAATASGIAILNFAYNVFSTRSQKQSQKSIAIRLSTYTAFAFITGCIWASPLYYFQHLELDSSLKAYQLIFIICILMGMMSSALGSVTAYLPAYYLSVFPMSLSLLAFLLQKSDIENTLTILSAGIVLFTMVLFWFAYHINKTIIDSIKLRFENRDLANKFQLEKERADQSNLAKSRFLAAASHDLRQPLHAIGLYADALDEETKPDIVQHLSQGITRSTSSLRKMLDVILDLSKIQAKVETPEILAFSLNAIMLEVVQELRPVCTEKKLTLKFQPTQLWVNSDPLIIKRILMNLLSNAIRYTNKGSILLGCRRRPDQIVEVQVIDTGIGLADHHIHHIFEEYYQIDNSSRDKKQGLGLGLSIVQGLAESIDCQIEVQSTPEAGSCFSLKLPTCQAEISTFKQNKMLNKQAVNALNILLIDDDLAILDAASLLLHKWGHSVQVCRNNTEAIEIIKSGFSPQCIISDYRLQGDLTGIDVLNKLSKILTSSFHGIILTGDIEARQLQIGRQSNYMFLHKPIKPAKLRLAISYQEDICTPQ